MGIDICATIIDNNYCNETPYGMSNKVLDYSPGKFQSLPNILYVYTLSYLNNFS